MVSFLGPDVAQVKYVPVIEISDSKKIPDGITLKTAGSGGSTEFTAEEVVVITQYLTDYCKAKGLDLGIRHDQAFLTGSN